MDRATVRVLALGSIDTRIVQGTETGLVRAMGAADVALGSGLVVSRSGLIITARHVTEAADMVAVLAPGTQRARPARILYVDPAHDIAVLEAEGRWRHHVRLPRRPRRLQIGQSISASGYPIDPRETYPAAVTGELSRVNNDGRLQAAIALNPGNSGGPVVDSRGRLVAVVSARHSPKQGVDGIALLEPVEHARDAYRAARAAKPKADAHSSKPEPCVADVIGRFVGVRGDESFYQEDIAGVLRQCAQRDLAPVGSMVVGAYAWNAAVELLEDRGAPTPSELAPAVRPVATGLLGLAHRLSGVATREAPFVRVWYPVARAIAVGHDRPFVPRTDEGSARSARGARPSEAAPAAWEGRQ